MKSAFGVVRITIFGWINPNIVNGKHSRSQGNRCSILKQIKLLKYNWTLKRLNDWVTSQFSKSSFNTGGINPSIW